MALKVVTLPGPVVTMAVGVWLLYGGELVAGIVMTVCGAAPAAAVRRA